MKYPNFHEWLRTLMMILNSYSVPETLISCSEGLLVQVQYLSETVPFDQGHILGHSCVSEIFSPILYFDLTFLFCICRNADEFTLPL